MSRASGPGTCTGYPTTSLVVPQASAAEEAGKLLIDLPTLWAGANLEERRKLLLAMLDVVYVDAKEEKRIVGIKPKPPFRPIFQVAATREGSGVLLMKEPPASDPEAPCLWLGRGRVELPLKRDLVAVMVLCWGTNSMSAVTAPGVRVFEERAILV